MRVCFVLKDNLNTFWQEKFDKITKPDLIVFGFNGLGLVSYKKELNGETEYFHDIASLSKELNCTVISACDTDTYGAYRHSAVVADAGKILGVSDATMALDDSEFVAGGSLRVYETKCGKIGVLVGEDLYFPELTKTLSLLDSDVIVCPFREIKNITEVMLKASAFMGGVPMALCSSNRAEVANIKGEIVYSTAKAVSEADIKSEREYRLITSRRRGLYVDGKADF